MKHHRAKHKRYLNADQKKTKQDENIKDVSVWKGASSKCLTSEYITNNAVICDRGEYMPTVKDDLYTDENINVLKISNLDLWVTDTKKSFNRTAFNFARSIMSGFHPSTAE
jgi:hypothetical protein